MSQLGVQMLGSLGKPVTPGRIRYVHMCTQTCALSDTGDVLKATKDGK